MRLQSVAGPTAGSVKYDVLTMITVAGLHGSPTFQTSMMRLAALVTARYNWRLDEFTVGQRDIARMWAVNERTVKREIKRLMTAKVLVCKRAGVRGRVGAYRLNYGCIAMLSEPAWADVGPDFAYRMGERYNAPDVKVVQLKSYAKPVPQLADGPWAHVMAQLQQDQPDLWHAWFAKLTYIDCENRVLRLKAPNAFLQRYVETHLIDFLVNAVADKLGPIDRVAFIV